MAVAEDIIGNRDLLEEILIRLPVKCSTRSKLVSKRWYSLISSPQFAHSHTRRKPSPPTGMFISDSNNETTKFVSFNRADPFQTIPSLSFLGKTIAGGDSKIRVLQSCNGLLYRVASPSHYGYCVCNPTTKQHRMILRECVGGAITLAYDHRTCPHYKVVLILTRVRINVTFEFHVYSSKDDHWKVRDLSSEPLGDPVVINGVIYWVDLWKEYYYRFDMITEEMMRLPMPPKPNKPHVKFYERLAECGGCLRCSGDSRGTGNYFYVFEMSRDFSEWVTKYVVDVRPIVDAFHEVAFVLKSPEYDRKLYGFSALCVVEKGEGGILVLAIPGKIVSYNLKHNTVKKLANLKGELAEPFEYSSLSAFQYIESLSLV